MLSSHDSHDWLRRFIDSQRDLEREAWVAFPNTRDDSAQRLERITLSHVANGPVYRDLTLDAYREFAVDYGHNLQPFAPIFSVAVDPDSLQVAGERVDHYTLEMSFSEEAAADPFVSLVRGVIPSQFDGLVWSDASRVIDVSPADPDVIERVLAVTADESLASDAWLDGVRANGLRPDPSVEMHFDLDALYHALVTPGGNAEPDALNRIPEPGELAPMSAFLYSEEGEVAGRLTMPVPTMLYAGEALEALLGFVHH